METDLGRFVSQCGLARPYRAPELPERPEVSTYTHAEQQHAERDSLFKKHINKCMDTR